MALRGRNLQENPMFARTERLLLRPGWADDAPALHEAIADEAVAFKLARLPWPYTRDDALAYLGLERKDGDANFLIFTRTSGAPRLVGGVGIHDEGGLPEIGYWIARRYWGLGFATEAGRAVVDIARHTLRLPRLVSGHFIDNPASGHVLRKLGFRATGRIVSRANRARGTDVPCALYALDLAEEDDDVPTMPRLMAA
jgi:RimJ/RimL family protein N-acetyltransferase